jgi:hypothetical protein
MSVVAPSLFTVATTVSPSSPSFTTISTLACTVDHSFETDKLTMKNR